MKKKITAIALVAALLAIAIIGGTLAYFTDTTDAKTNTFTVGKVDIDLTETSKEGDGIVAGTAKDDGTGYNYNDIVPGVVYSKEPTITVADDSLDAYVFADLAITNYDTLKAILAEADRLGEFTANLSALDADFLVGSKLSSDCELAGWYGNDSEYHLVYFLKDIDQPDESLTLFTGVKLPEGLDKSLANILNSITDSSKKSVDLIVTGYAIQKDGIDDEKAACNELFKNLMAGSPFKA